MEFRVSGMHSRPCVRVISAQVSDVAGVQTVSVDLRAGIVRVTGAADPAAVRAAITATGYVVSSSPSEP